MTMLTKLKGDYRDFRPGILQLVHMTVPPLYASYVDLLTILGMELLLTQPPRWEWRGFLRTRSSTVQRINIERIKVRVRQAGCWVRVRQAGCWVRVRRAGCWVRVRQAGCWVQVRQAGC